MEGRLNLLSELTGLLRDELRLVGELRDALARQRAGVANDDRAAVGVSVAEIGRIVVTLEEARRRRAMLVGVTTGDEGFPLARFETWLSGPLPEEFVRARADLQEAAQGAAIDVGINHAVLRRAVEVGGALLQRLFAPTAAPPAFDGAADREAGLEGTPGRRTDRSA